MLTLNFQAEPLAPRDIVQKTSIVRCFIHPLFRDSGSWAVLEAMTKGLPSIRIRVSGLVDMVDEDSSALIDASTPQELTDGIAEALMKIHRASAWAKKLGVGARRYVEAHYSWFYKSRCGETYVSIT